jgi:hypothetical protein
MVLLIFSAGALLTGAAAVTVAAATGVDGVSAITGGIVAETLTTSAAFLGEAAVGASLTGIGLCFFSETTFELFRAMFVTPRNKWCNIGR